MSVDPLQIAVVPPAGPDEEAMTTGNDPKPQTNENPSESCTLDGEAKVMILAPLCEAILACCPSAWPSECGFWFVL